MADTPGAGPDAPDQPTPAEEPTAGTNSLEQAADPAAAHTADPAATQTPAAPAATRDARPRPEFGEYAPEGWEWKPEDDEKAVAAPDAARSGVAGVAGVGRAGATHGTAQSAQGLQGVPHNLGAGTSLPSRRGASQSGSGSPYRAATSGQPAASQPAQYRAPAQGSASAQQVPARTGDRIATILLLVLGGFGALQSAFALMGMRTMFVFLEDAPGVTELTPPAWLDLTGKVVGIALLVLYGLVLVYSIRRLRARKLTFWAPLAAGVVASIVVVAIIASAMVGTPELMELMRDPKASAQILEYLQGVDAR